MARQTGTVNWTEDHYVVFVHDVYKSKAHGRVIEFYAQDGGMRVVPLSAIRVTQADQKKIANSRKAAA